MTNINSHSLKVNWVTATIATLMFTTLLWITGYLDILLSEDALGITFSLFIIYTLICAAKTQYKNVKLEQLNAEAVDCTLNELNQSVNYNVTLGNFINKTEKDAFKSSSINVLFERLRRYISRNPSQPLSSNNIETCEVLIEEDFNHRVAEELAQAENLTKYGMLGTFIGIVWGFASVNWASLTADTALAFVGNVVGGVEIALITSIIGLVCSLILLNQHKRVRDSHTHTHLKIVDSVQEMERVLCYHNTYTPLAQKMGWVQISEVSNNETQS